MTDVEMAAEADDGLLLAGTLTLPDGAGPHPAVLVLHGSGRLNRDGNALQLGPAVAKVLASRGIATLRYDRRGVGATGGDWRSAGFVTARNDAAAALRALAGRSDIGSVAVIGHSEGAVHAMALGSRPEVAAVVLLAGFARPGSDAMRRQAEMIAPKVLQALFARYLARVQATTTDAARVFGMPVNALWMRELLAHDSRPDLAAIKVPVLAITGEKDLQVDPADLDEIRRLVPGEASVHRIPDLTHLLRRDPGRASVRSYPRQLRRPVDADLLTQVADWLAAQFRKGPNA